MKFEIVWKFDSLILHTRLKINEVTKEYGIQHERGLITLMGQTPGGHCKAKFGMHMIIMYASKM